MKGTIQLDYIVSDWQHPLSAENKTGVENFENDLLENKKED